jgi:hypothetical protein
MFFSIDGERYRIFSSGTSQGGPPSMLFNVDGGRSRISIITYRGPRR